MRLREDTSRCRFRRSQNYLHERRTLFGKACDGRHTEPPVHMIVLRKPNYPPSFRVFVSRTPRKEDQPSVVSHK